MTQPALQPPGVASQAPSRSGAARAARRRSAAAGRARRDRGSPRVLSVVRRAVARAARARSARWLEEIAGGSGGGRRLGASRAPTRPVRRPIRVAAEFPDAGSARRPAPGRGARRARRPQADAGVARGSPPRALATPCSPGDEEADIELVLIGLEPGHRFPKHVHLGNEEVVLLAGALHRRVHASRRRQLLPLPAGIRARHTDRRRVSRAGRWGCSSTASSSAACSARCSGWPTR